MDIAKELLAEVHEEVVRHRKPITALGVVVGVFVLAGGAAAIAGWELVVALIAAVGILSTAIAVLVWTTFLHT